MAFKYRKQKRRGAPSVRKVLGPGRDCWDMGMGMDGCEWVRMWVNGAGAGQNKKRRASPRDSG